MIHKELFEPPQLIKEFIFTKFQYCEKCGFYSYFKPEKEKCPICGNDITYFTSPLFGYHKSSLYQMVNESLNMEINRDHITLAHINNMLREPKFIHFTTYTLDSFVLGILFFLASTVHTRIKGLIGKESDYLKRWINHLNEFKQRVGIIDLSKVPEKGLIIPKEAIKEEWEEQLIDIRFHREVHQKLFIIDGLICIKGSSNLTLGGLTNVGELREVIHGFDKLHGSILQPPAQEWKRYEVMNLLSLEQLEEIEEINTNYFCKFYKAV